MVICENCGEQYVYLLQRQAQGEGTSLLFLDNEGAKIRAEERAQQALIELVNRVHDPIPCPACGRIQTQMIPRAKRLHRQRMGQIGVICFIVAIIVLMMGVFVEVADRFEERTTIKTVFFATAILLALLGMVLIVRRAMLVRRYDPNSRPVEERIEYARTVAMRLADWEKRHSPKDKSAVQGVW